ncbi:MAG TPA: chemotaxis protein CheA [Peptococcaceae bacterium]|nr:MAG: CheA signal transduction histidine kinase [Clostridia bacterium 41_269]HBT20200.1 chemotaxis protein CheA [Peptococcaceae bacterium]
MSDFDMSQYLNLFLEEAEEQLQLLDEGLILLEQDRQNRDLLNQIFRAAHTIKGSAASMGFDKIAVLTHSMENVLDRFRNGELEVTQEVVDVLLECLDALQALKEEIIEQKDKIDISGLLKKLQTLQEMEAPEKNEDRVALSSPQESGEKEENAASASETELILNETEKIVLKSALEKGYKSYHIIVDLEPNCVMKSVRAYLVFNSLEKIGEIIKTVPTTEEIEEEKFDYCFELILVTQESLEKVKNTVLSISEIRNVSVREFPKLEDLNGEQAANQSEEKTVKEKTEAVGFEKIKEKTEGLTTDDSSRAQKISSGSGGADNKRISQTVRVDVNRLDKLLNLVGELVIEKSRLESVGESIRDTLGGGDLTDSLEEISLHIGRLSGELQEEIMRARMFPIEQVFNRFPRMVRDLARKFRKEINFIVEGKETELDRTVIEEIGDPLIHLLRNAIDHGIEPPEERKKLGKPPAGTVRLRAFHQENQIVITVEDDGRGMDLEKIKEKAVKKGLITPEAAEKLTDQEALNLIFIPGFSTAEKVSDVSGRGVGMDIVKSHIEKINGIMDISTKKGTGTKFTIKLPLTLVINRSLLIRHRGRMFAFPLANVVEIVEVKEEEIQYMQQQRVVFIRDSFLPLFDLEFLLGERAEKDHSSQGQDGLLSVVVVGVSERRVGIVVEELIGEQEIVIKSLGNYIGDVPGLAGATILGDGSVALILDVRGLIEGSGVEK